MSRRPDAPTPADDPVLDDADARGAAVAPDLSTLPIAGITRRRMAAVVAFVLATWVVIVFCLLYTSPSPRDGLLSRMPSSA